MIINTNNFNANCISNNSINSIGIFDSGLGGINVLSKLKKEFPNINYYYFADNKNSPYGKKTDKEIFDFSIKIIYYLIEMNVDIIIVACNTASSCLNKFKHKINIKIPIIGIIYFGIKEFLELSKENEKCAVICTPLTQKNNSYNNCLNLEFGINENKFIHISCSEFINYIEKGIFYDERLIKLTQFYFKDIKNNSNIKYIIYGCTHYPLINKNCTEVIYNKFNRYDIKFIDPSNYLLKILKRYISKSNNIGISKFYYSKIDNNFIENVNTILNEKINITYVNLK